MSLYDEDGIDGPFNRMMDRPIRTPRQRRDCQIIELYPQPPATLPPHVAAAGETSARRSGSSAPASGGVVVHPPPAGDRKEARGKTVGGTAVRCNNPRCSRWVGPRTPPARSITTGHTYCSGECFVRVEGDDRQRLALRAMAIAALRRIHPLRNATMAQARVVYANVMAEGSQLERLGVLVRLRIDPAVAGQWLTRWT